ncbi:FAD-dependent oxidoreductase, partial [Microbacterium sp. CnD16-F]
MTGALRRHDVVIVGGGVAALTTAWELARAGRDVVVLEAGDAVGGMLRRGVVAGVELDLGAESFATRTTGVADLAADARLAVQ